MSKYYISFLENIVENVRSNTVNRIVHQQT